MNKCALSLWKKTRWIPGTFFVSQKLYGASFRGVTNQIYPQPKTKSLKSFSGLVVVAPDVHVAGTGMIFSPGNPYFEIWASAVERYGTERVIALSELTLIGDLERVLEVLEKFKISHVILNPESPENPSTWGLPSVLDALNGSSNVTFWFVLFDSVHWDHIFKLNRIGSVIKSGVVLPIDGRIGKRLNGYLVEAESQCLPISNTTISGIEMTTIPDSLINSISFVGKIYDYRQRLFNESAYLDIAVNPHKSGEVLASYSDFLVSMAKYVGTLNLSRASSYPKSQLKSRVLEAAIVGCPIVTDDAGLAARYLGSQDLAVTAKNKRHLERLLRNGEALRLLKLIDRRKLMEHARNVAPISFWQSFEKADGNFTTF